MFTNLNRLRWVVRLTLALGVAASIAANILHANPHPISQTIAAWPPLALLLTVELVSRVPVHRRWLAVVRVLATGTIAAIAAWISYWHMAGTAARYGEDAAYLLPLTVDGLIVVASVSLVELAAKMRATDAVEVEATAPRFTPERQAQITAKRVATLKRNRAAKAKRKPRTPVQEVEALTSRAPVSPAPYGAR